MSGQRKAGPVPPEDLVFIKKGWGWELWHCNNEKYCGKTLHFEKGKKLSWHVHHVKEETFLLLTGLLRIYYGYDQDLAKASEHVMKPGDVFHVPPGLCHRMEALEESELIEFSTQHFESDSIRLIKGD